MGNTKTPPDSKAVFLFFKIFGIIKLQTVHSILGKGEPMPGKNRHPKNNVRSKQGNGKSHRQFKDQHHLVARSRGGDDIEENIMTMPAEFHSRYHEFFGVLSPAEAQVFLFLFLSGRKNNYCLKEIKDLQLFIKEGKLERAMQLTKLRGRLMIWQEVSSSILRSKEKILVREKGADGQKNLRITSPKPLQNFRGKEDRDR